MELQKLIANTEEENNIEREKLKKKVCNLEDELEKNKE